MGQTRQQRQDKIFKGAYAAQAAWKASQVPVYQRGSASPIGYVFPLGRPGSGRWQGYSYFLRSNTGPAGYDTKAEAVRGVHAATPPDTDTARRIIEDHRAAWGMPRTRRTATRRPRPGPAVEVRYETVTKHGGRRPVVQVKTEEFRIPSRLLLGRTSDRSARRAGRR
jgi:hypothetical protein